MVCGHCHGQRIPEPADRIEELLSRGDPYNAGDDLSKYYRPVWRETKVGDYSFANRFWANGSPRLTAYEYQGILRSRCYNGGSAENRINCLTCHSMHGGDPRGQITDENRTNKPCLECHRQYVPADALVAHTGHKAESTGSSCYNCHMPRVVYGVMAIHPTHDITVPDARMTVSLSVPNACNQCHLDRSVNWSIKESERLWPRYFAGSQQSSDPQFDVPEGARALFAGDALTRALAAEALGGAGPAQPDPQWAGPLLAEALADNYPIVRFFAANGLARGGWRLPKPDYLATAEVRERAIASWRGQFAPERWRGCALLASSLRSKRVDVDIEVGE
jgi:predicted CXXCH cytochrome family protein